MGTWNSENRTLLLGKGLITIGSILGIIPLAVLFSLPLFVVGEIILWKSDAIDRREKLFWTFLPIVGIIVIWTLIVLVTQLMD